jgi:hypothetical protein
MYRLQFAMVMNFKPEFCDTLLVLAMRAKIPRLLGLSASWGLSQQNSFHRSIFCN